MLLKFKKLEDKHIINSVKRSSSMQLSYGYLMIE